MLPFIIPIILSASFITPDKWSCSPETSIQIVYTPEGITVLNRNLHGYYDIPTSKIYLCPQILPDKSLTRLVYSHEYWHWFWNNKLTQYERNEWGKIKSTENSFISEYAKTNIFEDFAETFAYVLLKKEGLKWDEVLTIKKKFIRWIIYFQYK